MTAERRYQVFNHTDGVWASPFPMTLEEAEAFVQEFPRRFLRQGYYLTAAGQRIRPEDVELEIVGIDETGEKVCVPHPGGSVFSGDPPEECVVPEVHTMQQETENVVGNFEMGEWFGEASCIHDHPVRLFNIGRDHFMACDTCRTYIHVGGNLMSSWRTENRDIWQENRESIQGYKEVRS